MDYNLHKSNSTYFSDLDVSRTALVTKLYIKGCGILNKKLTKEGKGRGPLAVILGSVYTNFKREIPAYKRYEVVSKVVGWDEKWLYIVTWFLNPSVSKKSPKTGGALSPPDGKALLAMSVSKYVVKKGRWTVAPEAVLAAGGLLPEKPADALPATVTATSSGFATPAVESDGLTATRVTDTESAILEAGESIVLVAGSEEENSNGERENADPSAQAARAGLEWSWRRVDEERLRGLEVVKPLMELDERLLAEYGRQ